MSYRHGEDAGLPEGYYSRGGRLALCIKVQRGPTAAECADVGAECGAEGVAPARRPFFSVRGRNLWRI